MASGSQPALRSGSGRPIPNLPLAKEGKKKSARKAFEAMTLSMDCCMSRISSCWAFRSWVQVRNQSAHPCSAAMEQSAPCMHVASQACMQGAFHARTCSSSVLCLWLEKNVSGRALSSLATASSAQNLCPGVLEVLESLRIAVHVRTSRLHCSGVRGARSELRPPLALKALGGEREELEKK